MEYERHNLQMEPTPLAGSRRPAGARTAEAIVTPRGAAHLARYAELNQAAEEMKIELLGLDLNDWKKVAEGPATFANEHQLAVGSENDLLRSVAEQNLALFERTGVATHPWTGFLAVDRDANTIVGTCGFKSNPDAGGTVEIAYFTFPNFEGQGVASVMAAGLVECARDAVGVRRLLAHTLPEKNASTRVLEKVGFLRTAEVVDPEDGPVWRWERDPKP